MNTPYTSLLAALCVLGAVPSVFGGPVAYDQKSTVNTIQADTNGSLLEDYLRPALDVRYTHDFDMDFKGAPGQLSSDEAEVTVPLPPVRSGDFIFLAQLYYKYERLDIDTSGYRGKFDLHTVRVPIQAAWLSPNTPWFVYAYVEPGISSDFNTITRDSFDLTASIDVGYRFSPNFILALGVYYTNQYGRDLVLPGAGLLWKINDWWTIEVTPQEAASVFKLGEDWRVKAKAVAYGGRWTLDNNGARQRIELSGGKVGLDLEHRLFHKAWLSVGAGANVFNEMRIEDSPNHELFDRDLKPGLYVTGALRWEF